MLKPRKRSSPSAREIPSSSPQHIAWPMRCGPGASRPRPTTASSDGVARRSGCLKGWGIRLFSVGSSGTRSTQCPAPTWKLSSTGSRVEASRSSAMATRDSRPYRRRNALRLAPLQQPANYYEEVEVDHRAKGPLLKALKKRIRLQSDKVQCKEISKVLPGCLGRERFVEAWKPCDLILTSMLKVRDRAQKLLFERHKEYFPDTPCPSSIVRKTQGGRTSPQAALLEESLAVGYRHPAGSRTWARQAWSPSVPAGTLQETTRVSGPPATTSSSPGW